MFYVLLYVALCPFWCCNHPDGEERELVALLKLSSWCLVIVGWLFFTEPWVCLQFVIVVFPDHTHLLFLGLSAVCDCGISWLYSLVFFAVII